MTFTNPEIECKTTPTTFSAESTVTHVRTSEYRTGIILDSLDEVAGALRVYASGSVLGSRATKQEQMDALSSRGGGIGALLLLMGERDSSPFTERLTQKVVSELNSRGSFFQHFDYDGEGTFFKTFVEVKKVGKKYVLGLNAAYVGSEPENKLAETFGKPLALVRSSAEAKLAVVDDWWFNLNLENVLKDLPVSKKQVRDLTEYIGSQGHSRERPEITFKHDKQKFSLDIGLNADGYLRPEDGEWGSEYMQMRGKNIVGGAWTTRAENGNDKILPRAVQPGIVVSVTLPGERYSKPVAVTEEQMKSVQTARDYLARQIRVR